jgi:hypothetical protein
MRFFGKFGSPPDDVIVPIQDLCDYPNFIAGLNLNLNPVANSNRIGSADALYPEIALQFAIHHIPIVCHDIMPATRRSFNNSVHLIDLSC